MIQLTGLGIYLHVDKCKSFLSLQKRGKFILYCLFVRHLPNLLFSVKSRYTWWCDLDQSSTPFFMLNRTIPLDLTSRSFKVFKFPKVRSGGAGITAASLRNLRIWRWAFFDISWPHSARWLIVQVKFLLFVLLTFIHKVLSVNLMNTCYFSLHKIP